MIIGKKNAGIATTFCIVALASTTAQAQVGVTTHAPGCDGGPTLTFQLDNGKTFRRSFPGACVKNDPAKMDSIDLARIRAVEKKTGHQVVGAHNGTRFGVGKEDVLPITRTTEPDYKSKRIILNRAP